MENKSINLDLRGTDTNGGLLVTFVTDELASLRFVQGLKTIKVDEDKSPNPLYSMKLRGDHMSADANPRKPPKFPTEEPFQEEEVKRNIKWLLYDPESEFHAWMKNGRASMYVYCRYEEGESFRNAINQDLKNANVDSSGVPRFQVGKLPEKTTEMIWVQLEVNFLQSLG